ncbi:DEKNAAC105186 [Brettanomyces naardenensis]|uniref:Protein PNS1 n=1 Tax=Brettanomyces naardenensis TaxID=13370 RepID=A0A448YSQ7_BRENA|nr:DEKNAAC105186 [Brettanomyces naardenensis]
MATPPPYTPVRLPDEEDEESPLAYDYTFEKPKIPIESDSFEQSFPLDAPKYNDSIFTIVFFAVVLGLVGLTVYSYQDLSSSTTVLTVLTEKILPASKTSDKNARDLALLALATVGIPIICSLAAVLIAYAFPMFFVFVGYFLIPLTFFGICFTAFIAGSAVMAIIFFIFGVLALSFIYNNYKKLSFTALMLRIVIDVMRLYPSALGVQFIGSITSGIIGLIFLLMSSVIVADRSKIDDGTCDTQDGNPDNSCVSSASWWIYIYVMFAGFYIFEVLKNLIHVTISGIYGSWYFFSKTALRPRSPAWGAFKRGVTYCFGSICFGSLIVSLVKILRQILASLQHKLEERRIGENGGGDLGMGPIVYSILSAIVSIFDFVFAQAEYWIKWFNQYAYSYMALYGKDYLESARDTFEIMKFKGVFIIINDCLINATLIFYSILVCLLSSGTFYGALVGFMKNTNVAPEFMVAGFVLQILLAYFITYITLNVINSGFITFLIALCIKPEVFEENYHGYFVKMTNYYPEVSRSLNVPFPDRV